jgi:hypothetical protein
VVAVGESSWFVVVVMFVVVVVAVRCAIDIARLGVIPAALRRVQCNGMVYCSFIR